MRICLLLAIVGLVSAASVANAADKTIHDQDIGFSLTFPEGWFNERSSDEALRLTIKPDNQGLTCMVSSSLYNPFAPGSPSDPRKFIEGWSMDTWKTMMGKSFSTADFSNDRLQGFRTATLCALPIWTTRLAMRLSACTAIPGLRFQFGALATVTSIAR